MLSCHKHHDRPATSRMYGVARCKECASELIAFFAQDRAFGTGIGPEAHAEAQEARGNLYAYRSSTDDEGKPAGSIEWRHPK